MSRWLHNSYYMLNEMFIFGNVLNCKTTKEVYHVCGSGPGTQVCHIIKDKGQYSQKVTKLETANLP